MADLQKDLTESLERSATDLRAAGLPEAAAHQLERLSQQVDQPCVVAIVGRVKAGKSTFINALLGQDLARVGTTETTATINYFRYGIADPARPVRCYWRSGQSTDEPAAFLNALQGNDPEALRRADGIDHLEYRLQNPYLERITLVDTPGTGAAVDEHQQRTAEYLQLASQLRVRHDAETQRLGREADAVIYLIGPNARAGDQQLLEEFHQASSMGARAGNAVGVLAKIDLQPEVLARRTEFADRLGSQLKSSLNTVVPVSAGIERALDQLTAGDGQHLQHLIFELRRIPAARLEKLLSSEDLFLELETQDCPVTPEERQELLGTFPWGVFTTVARIAADPSTSAESAVQQLRALAGFQTLRDVLDRHFLRRGTILRAFRIVSSARALLSDLRFSELPAVRRRQDEDAARTSRFRAFVQAAGGDPGTARELEAFIVDRLRPKGDADGAIRAAERSFARLFHLLEEFNADAEALQQLEDALRRNAFSATEVDELRALLGLYGLEVEKRLSPGQVVVSYVEQRQQHWSEIASWDRNPLRTAVAERAVTRYGHILDELVGGT